MADLIQRDDGRWIPAIPAPLWVGWRLRRAQCGVCSRRFRDGETYRGHYALEHMVLNTPAIVSMYGFGGGGGVGGGGGTVSLIIREKGSCGHCRERMYDLAPCPFDPEHCGLCPSCAAAADADYGPLGFPTSGSSTV